MAGKAELKPGDWVEWQPNGNWTRELAPYDGAVGIVYAIQGRLADVRFPDLTIRRLNVAHLTWLPSRSQSRKDAAKIFGDAIEQKRASHYCPPVERHGNPHTFSDGPRRAGTVPGGKD